MDEKLQKHLINYKIRNRVKRFVANFTDKTDTAAFLDNLANELNNGADLIIFKTSAPSGISLEVARKAKLLAGEFDATFLVYDRADIAFLTEADGIILDENSITEAKKLQATINKNMGENAATLYGRTLVLRQELMNEENPEHSLETIQEALQASNEMVITSLRRWNKILEMQAYINEYKNSVAMQNFTRDAEDTADEE